MYGCAHYAERSAICYDGDIVAHERKADDPPSWALGERPYVGENGKEFAKRVMDKRYGKDKWYKGPKSKGPDSEYNRIRKWGDRAFE